MRQSQAIIDFLPNTYILQTINILMIRLHRTATFMQKLANSMMPGGKGKGKPMPKVQVGELTAHLKDFTTGEASPSAIPGAQQPAIIPRLQGSGATAIDGRQPSRQPISVISNSEAQLKSGTSGRQQLPLSPPAQQLVEAPSMEAEAAVRADDEGMDLGAMTESDFSDGTTACNMRKVSAASILSTFYPKFENESADSVVRRRMEAAVAEGRGVLEVSVKHSGSLFMWAGAQRGAFAKNSYGNEYSAVGVWVLGETLNRAWGPQEGARKQQELSDHLQANRLSLAMELVTSVLGDHGQRPLQDYVVVTAVVDLRGQPRFYPTPDVLRICRQWRLPSNQYWLFQSRQTVAQYMTAYQALSEEGTAQTVEETLARIADLTVPGTADHLTLQGNIMEGLVGRIVGRDSVHRLARVLKDHPVQHQAPGGAGAGVRLRRIYSETADADQRILRLLEEAGPSMCSAADWDASEGADVEDEEEGAAHLSRADEDQSSILLRQFLECAPGDHTTAKLQELVRAIKRRRMQVHFKCKPRVMSAETVQLRASGGQLDVLQQPQDGDPRAVHAEVDQHFVITVHAFADAAFRKYQKMQQESPELWPLYRGFFIDVFLLQTSARAAATLASQAREPNGREAAAAATNGVREENGAARSPEVEPEHLMLKMKLLPYKLRTFLIRNGLRSLSKEGSAMYLQNCARQLEIWGTSRSKAQEMMSLCKAWSDYITSKGKDKSLSQNNYLDEAEPFLSEWAKRSAKNARAVGAAMESITPEALEADIEEESAGEAALEGGGHAGGVTAKDYEGLLVFFPGIPGCAKSALCEGLLEGGDLGDGRKLDHLMGDATPGRYWKVLEARRKKEKAVVSLADKNAPYREAWATVEQVCDATDALGVPVVPASQGLATNPFDWETLAVVMWRVLQRKNHPGKLDADFPTAGSVVLMFFHFYDGMDRHEFEEELRRRFGVLVTIPVLRPDRPPMPEALLEELQAGDRLYQRMQGTSRSRWKRVEPEESPLKEEWLEWEGRLRDAMHTYGEHLKSMQVPLEEALQSVREQLSAIACGRTRVERGAGAEAAFSRPVQLAALHLPQEALWAALQKLAEDHEGVRAFVEGKEDAIERQLAKGHVTLVHKRSHGAAAVARYAPLVGERAEVHITALLHSARAAALAVEIKEEDWQRGIVSLNPFPHVTIWTAPHTPAVTAIQLPEEVEAGTGTRIPLPRDGWSFTGTVQLG